MALGRQPPTPAPCAANTASNPNHRPSRPRRAGARCVAPPAGAPAGAVTVPPERPPTGARGPGRFRRDRRRTSCRRVAARVRRREGGRSARCRGLGGRGAGERPLRGEPRRAGGGLPRGATRPPRIVPCASMRKSTPADFGSRARRGASSATSTPWPRRSRPAPSASVRARPCTRRRSSAPAPTSSGASPKRRRRWRRPPSAERPVSASTPAGTRSASTSCAGCCA